MPGEIISLTLFTSSSKNIANKIPLFKKKLFAERFLSIILVENNDFLVISKPTKFSVQGGSFQDVYNLDLLSQSWSEIFNKPRPLIVHRLDKNTTGLLLMALNRKMAQYLSTLLCNHLVHKEYLSLVSGIPKDPFGIMDYVLSKYKVNKKVEVICDGLKSRTYYRVLKFFKEYNFSLLSLFPYNGRTHQLRVHCSISGFPIIGDVKYDYISFVKRDLHLHSYRLVFKDYYGNVYDISSFPSIISLTLESFNI